MAKLKFNADDVLPRLSQVVGVVNSKNSLPILGDVLFVTRIDESSAKRQLSLTASDGETWLTVFVPNAEFDENMMFCVGATDIYKALANLKGCTADIDIDSAKHIITCNYGNGHFSLPYEESNEYPRPNMNADNMNEKTLDCGRLLCSIEKAGFATANDELRPVMNGVHFDFMQNGMVTVASDGHKLAKYTDLTIQHDDAVICGFTLPKKPSHTMLNVLSATQGSIGLRFNETCARFTHETFVLTTRLIEGRYPNYDSVIPKDNTIETMVEKAAMLSALKRVMPMGNTNSELVLLSFTMGNMEISTEDIDYSKSAKENVPCDFNGMDIKIGFKSSALLAILQNIDGDGVKILLKDATRAGLFKPSSDVENTEYVSLLMPMLIQS